MLFHLARLLVLSKPLDVIDKAAPVQMVLYWTVQTFYKMF